MGSNTDDFDFDDYSFGDGTDTSEPSSEVSTQPEVNSQESKPQRPRQAQDGQQRPRQAQGGQQRPRQAQGGQQRPNQTQNGQPRPKQVQGNQQAPNQSQGKGQQRQQRPRPKQQEIPIQDQRRMTGDRVIPNQAVRNNQQGDYVPNLNNLNNRANVNGNGKKKKKSKLPIILGVVVLLVIAMFAIRAVNMSKKANAEQEVEQVDYSSTNKAVYDALLSALNTYNAEEIDSIVGIEQGDSYLAQEWSYANKNPEREKFISNVCATVKFTYPETTQLDKNGEPVLDEAGSPVTQVSDMSGNEAFTITYIDYNALSTMAEEDKENILKLYEESDITPYDYEYNDEMVDLMVKWINSRIELPVTSREIQLQVSSGVFENDIDLDCLLFSSDEFHNLCDKFSQVASGYTGFKSEKYTEKEEQLNPEYAEWKALFDAYYKADKGKFKKGVSKWEPWYLRDDNNNFILDDDGKKIVNYYSVKDKDGNDWIQPSKMVLVDVEKERQVEDPWVPDSVIPYCFIGAYYCQNQYDGLFSPEVRIGDGSFENPAGVGTPIVTKCLGTDGKYHDVRVTLQGYWKGQKAIDYALTFSEKNRGFDINSVIQLICYEISVENLEDKEFSFESEMFLSDRNSNQTQRAGTMFGFTETETLKPHEIVTINDWDTSTEIDQKYVCWGSSFNRMFDVVYFRVLAGEGEVEPYSAYKSFTGEDHVSSVGKRDKNATNSVIVNRDKEQAELESEEVQKTEQTESESEEAQSTEQTESTVTPVETEGTKGSEVELPDISE